MSKDTIYRQAAIDALWKALFEYEDKTEKQFIESDELDVGDWVLHRIFVQNMNDIDRQTILDLPSAQPEQQWIPCSEGPPEEGHDVFITKEPFKIKGYEQNVIKAKRSVDPRSGEVEWWSPEFGTLTDKTVLAWMPLPEPYKGEK